ncbi:hypothetical protein [uncultured Friedmanniella sp.]|uniref:hypothetical protein n=1 Tax=uncultured Friedmanniella sp. TaxID=335381 RepID=UPI0035C9B93A
MADNDTDDLVHASGAGWVQRLVTRTFEQGVGPITGSRTYAEDRLRRWGDPERAISRIINESTLASGTSGFVTGVGGLITLPVTLPASLAGALVINLRMVGAIAHLREWELEDPHTQTVGMMVAAGSSGQAALSALGVKVGTEVGKQAIKAIPITLIRELNRRAGFMLLAKYGTQRSALTLAKGVPLLGGFASGAIDSTLTRAVGRAATTAFPVIVDDNPQAVTTVPS